MRFIAVVRKNSGFYQAGRITSSKLNEFVDKVVDVDVTLARGSASRKDNSPHIIGSSSGAVKRLATGKPTPKKVRK